MKECSRISRDIYTCALFQSSKFFSINSYIMFSKIVQESSKWRHYFILECSHLPQQHFWKTSRKFRFWGGTELHYKLWNFNFIKSELCLKSDSRLPKIICFNDSPSKRHPDNCPPRKIAPRLGLRFGSKSGLVLGLGATRQLSPRKIAPPRLGLGFGLGLVLGLGGNFSWGQLS